MCAVRSLLLSWHLSYRVTSNKFAWNKDGGDVVMCPWMAFLVMYLCLETDSHTPTTQQCTHTSVHTEKIDDLTYIIELRTIVQEILMRATCVSL